MPVLLIINCIGIQIPILYFDYKYSPSTSHDDDIRTVSVEVRIEVDFE